MCRRSSAGRRRSRRRASVAGIANRFSGGSFTPLTLADEIDEAMENLRLKKLTKVTVGPFVSDVFSKADDPLMEVVRQPDDLEEAWAIRWTVDTLVSAGTKMVGGGFFAVPAAAGDVSGHAGRPGLRAARRDRVPPSRCDAARHVPAHCRATAREHPSLRSASIHVLAADDRLIENA